MLSDVPNGPDEKPWHRVFAWVAFLFSLATYPMLLSRYAGATSPTFDEGMHIAAGFRYWQCGDYAINPEHPPLFKLIAAAPLRKRAIEGYDGACGAEVTNNARLIAVGYRLLNEPDANEILLQARKAAMLFPLILLVTIFFAARAWFGWLAAGAAVLLTVFEPNLTAHGALVTTDLAVATTTLLTVFCADRYLRKPSAWRLAFLGLALGSALASKHTAVFVPVIVLLQFAMFAWLDRVSISGRKLAVLGAAWICACVIGVLILWSTYRFRYAALPGRPEAFHVAQILENDERAQTAVGKVIGGVARLHLLPESYIAGLLYVMDNSVRTSFIFGKEHETGVWYYFPITLLVKTPISILFLFLLAVISPGIWKARGKELATLAIPILVFLLAAMTSKINLGVRHILPVYPFLMLFACAAAAYYAKQSRIWMAVCGAILVFECVSYARSYPNQIAYANELWGGPKKLRFYLGDSNLDWGQSLYQVKAYAARNDVKGCWIAWFGPKKPESIGLPCHVLAGPSFLEAADTELPPLLPQRFSGTVFVSNVLTNYAIFPYRYFREHSPDDVIAGSVLVFHGEFDLPEVAAERRVARGWWYLNHQQGSQAVEEFAAAEGRAASPAILHSLYGWALEASGKQDEARVKYAQAAADADARPSFAAARKAALQRVAALSHTPAQQSQSK